MNSSSAAAVRRYSRLSEDANRSVLLIDAGPAYPPDAYPPDLTTGSMIAIEPHRNWGYQSVPGSAGHGATGCTQFVQLRIGALFIGRDACIADQASCGGAFSKLWRRHLGHALFKPLICTCTRYLNGRLHRWPAMLSRRAGHNQDGRGRGVRRLAQAGWHDLVVQFGISLKALVSRSMAEIRARDGQTG